ncbi:MAG: DUF2752 domain-containing protein [Eubacterium sp.]|nr:DUF2752 domain-containing protein [Eubacterium sp.]
MKKKNKKIKYILVLALLALFFAGVCFAEVYQCPFRLAFGIPCPCCGMTRAVRSACMGHFGQSFHYHPLWPLFLLVLGGEVLYEFKVFKNKSLWNNILPGLAGVLILICYGIRMYLGVDI